MIKVDWKAIRPLNGSQDDGFEELCAQLARIEIPSGSQFIRKGTPDGGVECYAILSDNNEWGWQAKNFDVIGDSQWSQIDKSVNKALKTHPRLIQYYVCTPLNLPDARDGRKSAKERWDEHVVKWSGWASDQGMTVEFIYWGSSELIDRISSPDFISKARFWFDARAFDKPWFMARLEDAVTAAGARYTPEIHVNLPIADRFEAFGRTQRFFDNLKSPFRDIRITWNLFLSESKFIESSTDALISTLSSQVQVILTEFGAIKYQANGELPFRRITDQIISAKSVADELVQLLLEREHEFEAKTKQPNERVESGSHETDPFSNLRIRLVLLSAAFQYALEDLAYADDVAGKNLMILTGDAGTGKTHLLCDVARQRVFNNQPTILLMGQQFISNDPPWTQAFQQLDLSGMSAEDFIGAFESAAQAADCRALIIIDAINEGAGRLIWPSHLAAFLAYLERSPWIGVVLSVRSSYEEIIIPEEIRTRATPLTHHGFAEHEYDAMRTFFVHYGIELPSTPLLAPEFCNPLFLKILCRGLQAKGEHRLPRGFHGISAVFELYIHAVNERLADLLEYNPKISLVLQALEIFTDELIKSGETWLPIAKADKLVNDLLPGRKFEHSLYRGLVSEGMLMEEILKHHDSAVAEDVVFIGYERFADHLIAKKLLDIHLTTTDPASAIVSGDRLPFLSDEKQYVSPGLLEALCIQVPERTGYELISLAPQIIAAHMSIGYAFRQSIVWRAEISFSKDTLEYMDIIDGNDHRREDTFDVLLTVATLPGHPLNANFLNSYLRKNSMPDRDAWWSTYLHDAWGRQSTVDRLVDWASSIKPDIQVDDESVDLCSTTLAWMFTTSNRFLRDHATKALVCLLTGRLNAVVHLVERFADVDDSYITERVYAVAYGAAMRSHDALEVGKLAQCVYDRIFVTGEPPMHILLRDYARGVIERAIYLGSNINIDSNLIRPPYKSIWPEIPTEEEIKPFFPDWSQGSYDEGDLEWARNRIGSSVMSDDFARYVIGTNSSLGSNHWLSLRLEDHPWKSSNERMATLTKDFSTDENLAWESFIAADEKVKQWYASKWYDLNIESTQREESGHDGRSKSEKSEKKDPEIILMEQERDTALNAIRSALSEEHFQIFDCILNDMRTEGQDPPRFDISQIQRYILWRVFDLGWTTERFGKFDRFSIGHHGRDVKKAERIGKKYQWIAYHEIMALISDHFQYYDQYIIEVDNRVYCGPWQIHLRDIDPSCTLRSSCGGTPPEGHPQGWWAPIEYDNWGEQGRARDWVIQSDDLPNIEHLLYFPKPSEAIRWFNLQGYFNWRQPSPADYDSSDVERRELWYKVNSYLIRIEDAEIFKKWAKDVDFFGRWMPEPPEYNEMFLGEYGWSPVARYFQQQYCRDCGDQGLIQPDHNCPVKLELVTIKYLSGAGGFDCSVTEDFNLRLPTLNIVKNMGLRWSGDAADHFDRDGNLAVFDPTALENGPIALLFREDLFREFLAREKLTVCWIVIGEKRAINTGFSPNEAATLRIMGAYVLSDKGPVGFINSKPEEKNKKKRRPRNLTHPPADPS